MSHKSNDSDPVIVLPVKLANEYRLTAQKADNDGNPIPGTERELAPWFHNLITNTGMENFGTLSSVNWGRGCRVGSSGATPAFTDTNIVAIVASTATRVGNTAYSRDLAATNPYVEMVNVYRFAVGVAAGNLSEVGLVGATNDLSATGGVLNNGTTCSTRALILDGMGVPATVTVLSDEILDVTARQRLYIPGDFSQSLTPSGGIAPSTSIVVRPSDVGINVGANTGGWGGVTGRTGWDFTARVSGGNGENIAYVGSSSAINALTTGFPSGTEAEPQDSGGGVSTLAYVANSNQRGIWMNFGLGTANVGINAAGGVGALRFCFGSCSFQVGLTPRLVKNSDHLLDATLRIQWSRFTP